MSATFGSRRFVAAMAGIVLLAACGGGGDNGGGGGGLTATFTPTATGPAIDRVRLELGSQSGARVVLKVVFDGPDTAIDLYSFAFDIVLSNTSKVAYVPNSVAFGNVLLAFAGQGITVLAGNNDPLHPDHLVVGITKTGGGLGNGITLTKGTVLTLAFDVTAAGSSTLTFDGSPSQSFPTDPVALDHNGAVIGAVAFDPLSATISGS